MVDFMYGATLALRYVRVHPKLNWLIKIGMDRQFSNVKLDKNIFFQSFSTKLDKRADGLSV
jgi:hypothetical protein